MKDFKEHRLFSEYRLLYSSTAEFPSTMRFMFQLKDKINLDSLSYAINMVKKRYPYLCVELKQDDNGFYFIKNERDIILENLNKNITLNTEESNYHLISFQYSDDNYIVFNASHYLTDGNTAYALIRTLLYYYITKAYNAELSKDNIRLIEDEISEEEFNDPLVKPKNLVKPTQVNYSTCLHLLKDNHFENQGKPIFHLTINEKELMDYVRSIKATPATFLLLLLARAIKKINPTSEKMIRMNLVYDLRKALNTPLAHQSLISGILFDYDEKFINLSLEEEIKEMRGKIKETLEEPKASEAITSTFGLLSMIAKEKDMNKVKYISSMVTNKTTEIITSSLSYVGKANFGDAEKYITDFKTIASSIIPLSIQLAAVNGQFFLEFIQNFEDERYFNAFKEELDSHKIKYEFKEKFMIELPKIKDVI